LAQALVFGNTRAGFGRIWLRFGAETLQDVAVILSAPEEQKAAESFGPGSE